MRYDDKARRTGTLGLCVGLLLWALGASAWAAPVNVAWDPNPQGEGVTGYVVFYGSVSRADLAFTAYPSQIDVGNVTQATLDLPGVTYVSVVAYNQVGMKSDYSAELLVNAAAPGPFVLDASAGPEGVISPSGATTVPSGGSQTYTITPNTGYQVASVIVDGVSVGALTTYTFANVTANHTISATFATGTQSTYTVTASAGANGAISPSGATTVASGGSQTYAITPNAGYQVASVTVDGASKGALTSYTFTNVTASHTISATFSAVTYTVTASAGANGTISPSGATTVASGGSQTYTITPNAGYQVASVTVDGASKGALTTYTFTNVTASHTISATFSVVGYTVTATAGANGTISPSGATTVASGGSQTYAIAANSGYQISSVTVDGVALGAVTSYTFSSVKANHTISATFASLSLPSFTVTASAGPNGSVTPNGTATVTSGGSQNYNIRPKTGYQVAVVLVDGVSVGAVKSYAFTNVTANHTISAAFEAISVASFTLTASAGANGTISPSGTTTVASGGSQTYAITPSAGYQVSSVTVDGASAGTVTSYTFTNVTANHTISVAFAPVPANSFTLTASAAANGAISPSGTVTVASGGSQTYTITPSTGYQVSDVTVDGASVGAVTTYTFTNVTANHAISATFAAPSPKVRIKTVGAGKVGTAP